MKLGRVPATRVIIEDAAVADTTNGVHAPGWAFAGREPIEPESRVLASL
jgi:hypothetical protein